MEFLLKLGCVAIGSALGGTLRWTASLMFASWAGSGFPVATFAVNVVGCGALGWFLTWIEQREMLHPIEWIPGEQLRLLIAVGFLGSFTTFSTFEYELHRMWESHSRWLPTVYAFLSFVVGFAAVHLGMALAKVR